VSEYDLEKGLSAAEHLGVAKYHIRQTVAALQAAESYNVAGEAFAKLRELAARVLRGCDNMDGEIKKDHRRQLRRLLHHSLAFAPTPHLKAECPYCGTKPSERHALPLPTDTPRTIGEKRDAI
jgi:hypothetical protein